MKYAPLWDYRTENLPPPPHPTPAPPPPPPHPLNVKRVLSVVSVYDSPAHKQVNVVFNVHRNHKAYQGRGEGGKGGMEVGAEGEYIPIATLSPPE